MNRFHILSLRYAVVILLNLEEGEKNKIKRYFAEELRYADLDSFEKLRGWIKSLKEVRDYLEHYEEKKKKGENPKGVEEGDFFRLLGRILLPKLSGLCEGQLKSKHHKEEEWEKAVREGRKSRKEARRQYQDAVRTKKNIEKGKRQKLQKENETFRLNYLEWFPQDYQRNNAYRLENLRDYHFALGKEMLGRLKKEGGCCSFSEVEEFYSLHHTLNLRVALALEHLKERWLRGLGEEDLEYLKEKWLESSEKKGSEFEDVMELTHFYETHKEAGDVLKNIRNDVAHGRMAFMGRWEEREEEVKRIEAAVERREDEEKVKALKKKVKSKRKEARKSKEKAENYFFALLLALRFEDEERESDRLYSDISNVLKSAKRMEVWLPSQGEGKPMDLAMNPFEWKDEKRNTLDFLRKKHGENIKVVRYKYVRKQAGLWKKNLQEGHKRVVREFS